MRPASILVGRASILVGLLILCSAGASSAASVGLRQAITGATSISANPGDVVTLELFLDTDGLSLEGYYLGIDFTGGAVSIQNVAHQPLTGLFPDLFGAPEIDNGAYTIRRMNQTTFTTPLAAGTYVLDLITVEIGATLGTSIDATPGLFGESLGLGGGACPSGSCSVALNGVQITPEPGTALLLASGLLGLGTIRRRRHH